MAFDLGDWLENGPGDRDERDDHIRSEMLHGEVCDPLFSQLKEQGIDYNVVASGGGEDRGSDYFHVFEFTKEGEEPSFWKVHGWYASHYGTDYEGFNEVKRGKPVQYEWNTV